MPRRIRRCRIQENNSGAGQEQLGWQHERYRWSGTFLELDGHAQALGPAARANTYKAYTTKNRASAGAEAAGVDALFVFFLLETRERTRM